MVQRFIVRLLRCLLHNKRSWLSMRDRWFAASCHLLRMPYLTAFHKHAWYFSAELMCPYAADVAQQLSCTAL